MRITRLEISKLDLKLQAALTVAYGSYAELNYALVKVHTDSGMIGLGEASPDPQVTGETQESVFLALHEMSNLLVDKDPMDVVPLLAECRKRYMAYPAALAAIDMALYDLAGQSLGVPVYQLLGSKARSEVGLYPVVPLDEPDVMAGVALQFIGMGARMLKVKLGTKPEEDLRRLQAIRNTVGSEIVLRLDINQGWQDAETAISAIRQLEDFNVAYIEQPVRDDDLKGMAEVSAAVDLPIMADESCHTAEDVLKIACMHAADMINIKLMKCGGIYEAGRMLAVAEAAGLPCILGSMGESSIGSAAGLHFVVSHPSVTACELIGPLFITNDPATGFEVDMARMSAIPSELPGLGVRLI